MGSNFLPIINLNEENMSNHSPTGRKTTSDLVRSAFESYGCFLAKYDKISPELQEKMFGLSKELFQLPTEIKVQNTSNILGAGYGANFSFMPLVEYLGIENGATLEATMDFTNLMWPAGHHSFCETAFTYSKLLAELHNGVMRMVFDSYGVERNSDRELLSSSFFLVRFLKYRLPRDDEVSNVGLYRHVDKTFLGIVDTNHVTGLEIEMSSGEWFTYEPSPSTSTFLVIAGEPLEAWSNGRIYAPLHQVVIRGGDEEKYSICIFSFIREIFGVPEELVDEQNPLQFKPFDHMKFLDYIRGGRFTVPRLIKDFCGV